MEGDVGVDLVEHIVRRIRYTGGDGDSPSAGNSIFQMIAEMALAEANAIRRPLACSSHIAVNPITHLHRGHVVTSRQSIGEENDNQKDGLVGRDEEDKQRGCAAIDASPELQKFVSGS